MDWLMYVSIEDKLEMFTNWFIASFYANTGLIMTVSFNWI